MNLFTNGCSFTYGGALGLDGPENNETRLKSVWPYYLGNLLNADNTYNLSDGCGSNDRTLRTTISWLLHHKKHSPEKLNNLIAVIQLTELSRYEYYVPKNSKDKFEDINDAIGGPVVTPSRWAKCKVDLCQHWLIKDYGDPPDEFYVDTNDRAISRYTDIEGSYKLLYQIEAFTSIFKKFNIKYFYWDYDDNRLLSVPDHIRDYILNDSAKPWLNWDYELNQMISWKYDVVAKTDFHPSLIGHREVASLMYEKIKNSI